ncbi:MAG: hypothetical protein M3309_10915 [Actinomycetota bacterium]|nr:hypothetical protein [Actinomycetota bacterium]
MEKPALGFVRLLGGCLFVRTIFAGAFPRLVRSPGWFWEDEEQGRPTMRTRLATTLTNASAKVAM